MTGFSLLWGKILRSSLWVKESKETRLVWITLLAMKDARGEVAASVVGLADQAKVSVDECREALAVLMGPDADDSSGVAEGRRIEAIEGGWRIINHDKYRFSTESRREFWREQKRRQREGRTAAKSGKPLAGEVAACKAAELGHEGTAGAIAGERPARAAAAAGADTVQKDSAAVSAPADPGVSSGVSNSSAANEAAKMDKGQVPSNGPTWNWSAHTPVPAGVAVGGVVPIEGSDAVGVMAGGPAGGLGVDGLCVGMCGRRAEWFAVTEDGNRELYCTDCARGTKGLKFYRIKSAVLVSGAGD